MTSVAAQLLDRIVTRRARAGVVGLGYVGLPLALELARGGLHVTGIDRDTRKVAHLRRGESYIPDVSGAEITSLTAAGRLTAAASFDAVATLDTVNICVPTPLRKTRDPDLLLHRVGGRSHCRTSCAPGMLVTLESTTYPGTTEEVVQPMLERGGLKAGVDFFLAFSPERVDPGNPMFKTRNVPKVVGGTTRRRGSRVRALRYGDRHGGAGQLAARGRDGQAARKHLPRRQHRHSPATSTRRCRTRSSNIARPRSGFSAPVIAAI